MLQLDLKLDDANLLRKSIGDTRQKIYVLQHVEKLLVEKIQVVCTHDPRDKVNRYQFISKGNRSHVKYCGLCNKRLTTIIGAEYYRDEEF